ncbi:MAG: hypothetical protein RSI33_10110 [Clostridia bacterium]
MTEKNPNARRGERARHLYVARELHPNEEEPIEFEDEPSFNESEYTPNEQAPEQAFPYEAALPYDAELPYEEALSYDAELPIAPAPAADFSAYYRRDAEMTEETAEPTFAPPLKLDFSSLYTEARPTEEPDEQPHVQGNVYRPREATWANTARREVISAQGGAGYHVEAETADAPRKRRRRRHRLRRVFTVLTVLVLLAAAGYLFRAPIGKYLSALTGTPQSAEQPFTALTTPAPVKGYDAAPPVELVPRARAAIGQICGTLQLKTLAVTDTHVLTSNLRADGLYDYYLFSADEGKLLCYFEGLLQGEMFPQADHRFYVKQAPYLINANGSSLIRMEGLEQTYSDTFLLKPMQNGWAVIESNTDHSANYINTSGQLLSTLWFARTFPFTGKHTVAYVDTGSVADAENRYILYVLSAEGTMSKWQTVPDLMGIVGSACSFAYLSSGELYRLDKLNAPLFTTPEAHVYLDCDALVAQDANSGKYGLFVQGEQQYDFEYDRIEPVACDITWAEKQMTGAGGSFTLHAVQDAPYPKPLSLYFLLVKDGHEEYVALSTTSANPISLPCGF